MRIGIFGGNDVAVSGGVDAIVSNAQQAADEGFASFWLPQIFGADALVALAVVGREVERIELGTAVVPTFPRHPLALAAQALTVQSASGGRLVLGIGLSHQMVVEGMWGYSFEKPVRHMREYLAVLKPAVDGEQLQFQGETVKAFTMGPIRVAGGTPCPVLVAALGPQMLELTARLADGTITWMVGPSTLADLTVPTLTKAAEAAGRPAPRVVVGLPVCVTDDAGAARERAAAAFAVYGQLPSYRAMLDREGASGPADVAIVGDEATVRSGIERLGEAGATDFMAAEFGTTASERSRTRELLRSLL